MFAQSRLAELEINSCEDFAMFHSADDCFRMFHLYHISHS